MYQSRVRLSSLIGRRLAFRIAASLVVMVALLAALALVAPDLLARAGVIPTGRAPAEGAADWIPSYARDVEPIFARACIRCHGPQRADKGLRLDGYQRTMAGDSYGTVVIPGDSSLSAMVSVLKYGTMPHGGAKLTATELDTIARWIDAGARNE